MKLVIVSVSYNNAPFLTDYFTALEHQSDKDFQVVFVDHGSTDNTKEVLKKWIPIFNEKLYVINIENNTGSPVLPYNTGFHYAIEVLDADWVWRVDTDDYLDTNAIELAKKEISSVKNAIGAIAIESKKFGKETGLQFNVPNLTIEKELKQNGINAFAIYNANVWELLGGYSSKFRYEDYDYWIRFLMTGHTYKIMKEPVHNYRRHDESLTAVWGQENDQISKEIQDYYKRIYEYNTTDHNN